MAKDIPENEEACVCYFEQDLVSEFYEIRHRRNNGLDGKVSYIFMRDGENG